MTTDKPSPPKERPCPQCGEVRRIWATLAGLMCSSCISKFNSELERDRPYRRC
jgi:hypothetical protein